MKMTEIKLEFPSERTRALRAMLSKSGSTLEAEMDKLLEQLYKNHVRQEVREYIVDLEFAEEFKTEQELSCTPADEEQCRQYEDISQEDVQGVSPYEGMK